MPACGTLIPLIIFVWTAPRPGAGIPVIQQLKRIDWLGALLLLSASVLLVFGLEQGSTGTYAWTSKTILTSLTVSGVSWGGFVVWQQYLIKRKNNKSGLIPIFPMRAFSGRIMTSVLM